MTWLLRAKGYLYVVATAVAGLGALLLRGKILKYQRDRARGAAERYRAQYHRQKVIAEKDADIAEQTKSRRVDALQDIKNDRVPRAFDANRVRDSSDD